MNYSDYYQFCTVRQLEYLRAIEEHGSARAAAKQFGVNKNTINEAVASVKKKAALQGFSPEHDWTHPVPETHIAKGISTYYNEEGKPTATWVKADIKQGAYLEAVKEAVAAFIEDVPSLPVAQAPKKFNSDVIPWLQIGDAHLGMLAHAAEVGENFDLKIAEQELCGAISILIDELPSCERMVINDLGDFTHYENYTGTTEASGHALDCDTRFPKMIKTYSRVMRFIVDKCLEKSKFVDVIVNQGNHSRTNDIWMAELLRVAYGESGRVNILNNESVFIAYRMGNTLVMTHHSDKCKPKDLVNVMTSDFRKDFGETEHHYIDIGHVHHGMVMKEHPSVFVESFNHLAGLDKWAHDFGYRNRKSITIILRSKTYGEVGRRLLPIQEIRARLTNASGKIVKPKEVYSV